MKDFTTLIICSLHFITFTSAQWSSDPALPQLIGSGIQPQIAATSDGGVYFAWLTDGNYHVYLQRFNTDGIAQFGDGGMVVSDQPNSSWIAVHHMNLAVDGNDNAIISTLDTRTGIWQVYVYKITPDGSMPWGTDGLALSVQGSDNISPRLTVLSDNSVAVAWCQDYITVRIQRISESGALQWGDDGVHIVDGTGDLLNPLPLTVDGTDVLLQWNHQTGPHWAPDSKLYLQKYNSFGIELWDSPVVAVGPVVFPTGNYFQESVGDYAGGSFSTWTEMAGSNQSAVAQRISGAGEIVWGDGVEFSTNSGNFRTNPHTSVAGGSSEIMAAWTEANGGQSQHGVYAQRLDENGNRLWGPSGIAVVSLNGNYSYLDLSVEGFSDDMVAAYIEQSVNNSGDIYAARLDADGNSVWMGDNVTVTNSGSPKSGMITGKGTNCLFIAWTENGSVYAHCLRDDGTLGAPDVSGGPGDVLLVPSEYATIQDAINASENRDTVLVAPGTYQESINYSGKNIVVGSYYLTYGLASFIEQTIIDGNQSGSVVKFENGEDSTAVLTGFTIQNGNGSGIDGYEGRGGGVFCINSSPTLNNLAIDENQSETSGAGLWFGYSNSQLVDLAISNNVVTGENVGAGGGISINYNSNLTLNNILLAGNEAIHGAGIELWSYSKPLLHSVTITNNTGSYGSGLLLSNGCHPTLINSIIWDNSSQDIEIGFGDNPPDTVSIYYSVVAGGQDSIITHDNGTIYWSDGNIDANPLFCDAGSGDYTLSENSPCIDAGDPGSPYDPDSTIADMGAFGVGCGPYNFSPIDFSLLEPSDSAQITIDDSNMNDGFITFSWDESSDANGDSLVYLMRTSSSQIGDFSLDTNVTSIDISYMDLIGDMTENNVTSATIEWAVDVTDGIDTVTANNAPFILNVDGSDAMSAHAENLIPDVFVLHQNYPNPFNPVTTLCYDLPEDGLVNITIYDTMGRIVKTLINDQQIAGFKLLQWNAANDGGSPVSTGLYLYMIQSGDFRQTKKMILLK